MEYDHNHDVGEHKSPRSGERYIECKFFKRLCHGHCGINKIITVREYKIFNKVQSTVVSIFKVGDYYGGQ